MAPVMRLCLLAVVAVGAMAFPSKGKGKALQEREVGTSGTPSNQAFPLHHEWINGAEPGPAVPRCQQERETGICRANIPRWFYDNTSGTCRRFIYGGCRGNDNNFLSEKDCRTACLGTTEDTITTSSTTTTAESTTPAPDVTTPKSGDGEEDSQKGSGALWTMVVVVLIMVPVGVLLLVLSAVIRKLRRPGRRSYSTTTLIGGSPASSIRMVTPIY